MLKICIGDKLLTFIGLSLSFAFCCFPFDNERRVRKNKTKESPHKQHRERETTNEQTANAKTKQWRKNIENFKERGRGEEGEKKNRNCTTKSGEHQ